MTVFKIALLDAVDIPLLMGEAVLRTCLYY